MKNLENTKTLENLKLALSGESGAFLKYSLYSAFAKEAGLGYIAKIFEEIAHNEKEHGEQWLKLIYTDYEDTYENLVDAIKSEHYENAIMYKDFEKVAREEGLNEIADEFKRVGSVESHHELQFEILASLLKNNELFESYKSLVWQCSNCGYEVAGSEPPKECPLCKHPQGYYVPKKQIYY